MEDFLRLWDSLDEDFDFFCDLGRGRLLLSIHPSLVKGGVWGDGEDRVEVLGRGSSLLES